MKCMTGDWKKRALQKKLGTCFEYSGLERQKIVLDVALMEKSCLLCKDLVRRLGSRHQFLDAHPPCDWQTQQGKRG